MARRSAWRTRTSSKGFSSTFITSGWKEGAEACMTVMFGSPSSCGMISTGARYMMCTSPVLSADICAAYSLM